MKNHRHSSSITASTSSSSSSQTWKLRNVIDLVGECTVESPLEDSLYFSFGL